MFRATLKSLFARKRRLILTVVSIVLGVGFVVGTFVLTDTMNKAFDDLFTDGRCGLATWSSGPSRRSSPRATGPGVAVRRGTRSGPRDPLADGRGGRRRRLGDPVTCPGYAQMKDPATGDPIGGVGPPTIGTNWTDTNPSAELRDGEPPRPPTRSSSMRRPRDATTWRSGEQVTILFRDRAGGVHDLRDRRLRRCRQPRRCHPGRCSTRRRPSASSTRKGVFDSISVLGDDGVRSRSAPGRDPAGAAGQGRGASPAPRSPTSNPKQLKEGLGFFRIALLVFAFIALFVGAFIIFNTFSIIVAQRSQGAGAAPSGGREQASGDDVGDRRGPRRRVRGGRPGHRRGGRRSRSC